jgi:DNA-directed RNA polymerase sigma subunit (sigma70/sigma32)
MFVVFILLYYLLIVNSYLTNNQWSLIKTIIIHKNTPYKIKSKTKQIIFNKYYYWTRKQTYQFIENNSKITYSLNKKELMEYSYIGLHKAIDKYNYTSNNKFSKYAEKIIYYELYRGVTELSPLKLLPHNYRVNRKWRQNNRELYKRSMTKTQYAGNDDWLFENKKVIDNNSEKLKAINKLLNTLDDPLLKQIFKYRYNYDLSIKNKLDKVSDFFDLSNETIRVKINLVKKYLKTNLKNL